MQFEKMDLNQNNSNFDQTKKEEWQEIKEEKGFVSEIYDQPHNFHKKLEQKSKKIQNIQDLKKQIKQKYSTENLKEVK